jgi:hypothetical protein
MSVHAYRGRFAPSPTGPLHLGSLFAALVSWVHARQHCGQWSIRIDDLDTQRCDPQWSDAIIATLTAFGLTSDAPIVYQSDRLTAYGEAFAQLSYTLPGGGRLGAYVNYRDVDSDGVNRSSDQWTGIVSYTLGRQIGPAEMTFQVGQSVVDYDRYSVIVPVPGGRRDDSVFGGVTATFKDWSYMGFVPTMSFNAEKSRSNISRFDVDETALTVGIRSEF